MRIQDHLFQGYFGKDKKVDSVKYYHKRVDKLKGLDKNLDEGIDQFKTVLENHNKKLNAYLEFLKKLDIDSLNALKSEIKVLEGMFNVDEESTDNEKRYILRVGGLLKDLISNEENSELSVMEKDVANDIKALIQLLESICPLWTQQLEFVKRNDEEILGNHNNIKVLSDILKEEGDILRLEEQQLKKIDLKTGAILRKTTLKMRDLDKTSDMDMTYREIKHIR